VVSCFGIARFHNYKSFSFQVCRNIIKILQGFLNSASFFLLRVDVIFFAMRHPGLLKMYVVMFRFEFV